ncbi:MAG: hypothetical protein HGB36_11050 [Chlorobiaceae bacterium]|nr:hypothetical protein [Chlorobiaceae bacterium]
MYNGMTEGLFTGEDLSKYCNDVKTDWLQARKNIQDSDGAREMAVQAKWFYQVL